MKKELLLFAALGMLVTGCATLPEKIAPAEISEAPYMNWSCEQLSREQPRLAASLAGASDAQRRYRKADITGILFIGLPVATLTGFSKSSEIARLKGELQTLRRVAALENCPLPEEPADTSPQTFSAKAGASGEAPEEYKTE